MLKAREREPVEARQNRVGGAFRLAPLTPQLQACRSAPGGS